jgi:hypothetical protein
MHPIGATLSLPNRWGVDAMLLSAAPGMMTFVGLVMVHALGLRNNRYGLQTMCEGGGMANVTILERL